MNHIIFVTKTRQQQKPPPKKEVTLHDTYTQEWMSPPIGTKFEGSHKKEFTFTFSRMSRGSITAFVKTRLFLTLQIAQVEVSQMILK